MSTSALDMRRRLRRPRGTAAEMSRQDRQPTMGGMGRGLAQAAAGQTNARTLPLPNPTASAPLRSDPQAFSRQPRFGPSTTGAGAPSGMATVPSSSPINTPALARSTAAPMTGTATRATPAVGSPMESAFERRAAEISRGGVPDSYSRGIGPGGQLGVGAAQRAMGVGLAQPIARAAASPPPGLQTPQQIGDLQVAAIRAQNLYGARGPQAVAAANAYVDAISAYNTWASQNGAQLLAPAPGISNLVQTGDVPPVTAPMPPPTTPGSAPDPRFPAPPPLGSAPPPGAQLPPQVTDQPQQPPQQQPVTDTTGGGTGGVGGGGGGAGTGGGTTTIPGTTAVEPPPDIAAIRRGLAAPQDGLGGQVATFDASLADLGREATVEGRLENLLSQDNPLLARAQQRGLEIAASRGLLNSSIGAGIGVAALMDQALNIATPDAAAMQEETFRNQDAINTALQYNTEAQNLVNRADQAFRQQWTEGRQRFGEASTLQRQAYDENLALQQQGHANELQRIDFTYDNMSEYERDVLQPGRVELQNLQGKWNSVIQNNATAGALWSNLLTTTGDVLQSDQLDTQTKSIIANGLRDMTGDVMELIYNVSGFDDPNILGPFPEGVLAGAFGGGGDRTIRDAEGNVVRREPADSPSQLQTGERLFLEAGNSVTAVPSGEGGPTAPLGDTPSDRDTTVRNPDGSIAYRQPFDAEIRLEPGQYIVLPNGARITG